MNLEIKTKWLEALRSDKYQQGLNQLRNNSNHFCCMGVYCDILDPSGWSIGVGNYYHDSQFGFPSEALRAQGELSENEVDKLIGMNDSGRSFAEIADYIETTL